jgi:hypothetical protein
MSSKVSPLRELVARALHAGALRFDECNVLGTWEQERRGWLDRADEFLAAEGEQLAAEACAALERRFSNKDRTRP